MYTLEVKVTKIRDKWHTRLLKESEVLDEMACENRIDIGWCCREMMRWHDKMGGMSHFAGASRMRQLTGAKGRVFYCGELDNIKQRAKHATV